MGGRSERNQYRTFKEAAEKYLIQKRNSRSIKSMKASLDLVMPYIGHIPICDVDNDALDSFKDSRFRSGIRAGTINKELAYVTAVLTMACRLFRWTQSVPLILSVEGPQGVPYVLTRDQQDELFKHLPGWLEVAALFAVNTGLRKQELLTLDWRNEVRHGELVGFILGMTKNGQQRFCVCNSIARSVIEGQRGKHNLRVFPNAEGKQARKSQANYAWSKAWKAAGLPSDEFICKGPHNLRHTFGHRLRACGVPKNDRSALLGHDSADITTHYSQPDIERLTEYAERVVERRETVILRRIQPYAQYNDVASA